jgi:hypothetical protein
LGRRSGFKLEEIDQAMAGAGASEELRRKVRDSLAGTRKPGRKPEPDDALLIRLAQLVLDGEKPYGAANAVTKDMTEPPRKTTRNRIYKKYCAKPAHWQEKGREARLTLEERRQEAMRLLRAMQDKAEASIRGYGER